MKSLLRPKEVAVMLQINYRKTLELIIMGDLKAYKIGNSYRIHECEVREFLENSKYKSGWKI